MEIIDLSIETLMAACRGNVEALPSFMVHDNDKWQTGRIQLDNKNRIHMRRATFSQVVIGELPLRAGLWHSMDVQEFHIDLQPHHLQGEDNMGAPDDHTHSRKITLTDSSGRNPMDEDYGEAPLQHNRPTVADLHAARAETDGQGRGVRSSTLSADRSE